MMHQGVASTVSLGDGYSIQGVNNTVSVGVRIQYIHAFM